MLPDSFAYVSWSNSWLLSLLVLSETWPPILFLVSYPLVTKLTHIKIDKLLFKILFSLRTVLGEMYVFDLM